MQIYPYIIRLIAITLLVLMTGPVYASAQIRQPVGDYGYIDWEQQRVFAYGMGAAPADVRNVAQRRALSGRAATVDARRNLLEVVKGVQIDSQTRVEDLVVTSDVILTRVSGLLEGSMVDENIYQEDGSSRARVSLAITGPMAKLLISQRPQPRQPPVPPPAVIPQPAVPVTDPGQQARLNSLEQRIVTLEELVGQLIALNLQRETPPPNQSAAEQQAKLTRELQALSQRLAALEQQKSATAAPVPQGTGSPGGLPSYTSLVVDARNHAFQPSLRPNLYGEGHLLYPSNVNPDIATSNGYIRYFRDLSQAQQSPLAGSLPFTARVMGLHNDQKSDLTLRTEDAQIIMALLQQPKNFLRECRVLIVF